MGNITEWSGFGYVKATRNATDRNYWRQLVASLHPTKQWMVPNDYDIAVGLLTLLTGSGLW